MDREKVIEGLECCASMNGSACRECPYSSECVTGEVPYQTGTAHLAADALALLEEKEARILDWDELEDWGNAVWFDDKDEHECYIALIANVGTYDAKFTNVEPGNIHSLVFMRDFYMKEWRCWSARPTIKQRQAVKWE